MTIVDNIAAWWAAAQGRPELHTPAPPPEPLPPQHPYFPQDITIAGYVENEASLPVLMASLAGMLGFAILAGNVLALKVNPRLTASGLAVVSWFVTCEPPSTISRFERIKGCAWHANVVRFQVVACTVSLKV